MSSEDLRLMLAFLLSVATLVVLIARFTVAPFIALLIASIVLGLTSRLDMIDAWTQFNAGVGSILGSTAMVIGLGAVTGALLQKSGGATVIAHALVDLLGVRRLGWTMLIVGLLVGVGVWFTVGLVLLVPITLSLARVARVNILVPAMSVLAGLSAMHGLAPPHPGPLVAINLLSADTGKTILWSLVVGSAAAALAGPIFWRWFDGKIELPLFTPFDEEEATEKTRSAPSLIAPMSVIGLPIGLMLLGSFAANWLADKSELSDSVAATTWLLRSLVIAGTPTMAMLFGVILAYWLLGLRCGFTTQSIAHMSERSLYPVANVLLVVGAGAGFSKVLIASGVGESLAELAQQTPLPTLVLGWLIAAAFRVATGSATTAITAAGGIVSVIVGDDQSTNRELLVLALGAGSLTLSHVNDGGFWFVKEYFGLSVQQTLKTWTVLETMLSLIALAIILLLAEII